MPGPWSRTVSSPSASATSTGAPGGLHLAALSSRFAIARSRLAGTPDDVGSSQVGLERHLGMVAPRALGSRPRSTQVEPHVLERRPLLLAARELGQLARSARSSRRAARRRRAAAARARRAAARSSAASTSMFVRRLVSGVRSSCEASCDELALALLRVVERLEHRVEASRRGGQLVVAGRRRSAARGRASRATCSAVSLSRGPASAPRARRGSPSAAAIPIPPSATSSRPEPDPRELVVDARRAAARPGPRSPGAYAAP